MFGNPQVRVGNVLDGDTLQDPRFCVEDWSPIVPP